MGLAAALLAVGAARPAVAQDAAAIDKLNKQALDAFDGLNFDQAKTLLEKAISDGEAAGLDHDPSVARSHLDLGMLLIAGFQNRDDAIEHFKTALAIKPGIAPPAGLFNPEVQAAFDEAKEKVAAEEEARQKALAPRRPSRPGKTPVTVEAKEGEGAEEVEEETETPGTGFYLGLGFGSGGGIAKGHLDANKTLFQNGVQDNSWSGGVATSRLGHLTVDAGYFVSSDLLLTVEGRIQIVSGTSEVMDPVNCPGSGICSPPSTGIAVLGKGTWFLSPAPVRPFLVGGLGGGAIRQVVKLNVKPDESDLVTTHCGSSGKDTCVDTVTGGPFLLAAGGGVAYQMGSFALLGSAVANVGIPKFMLNIDLTLGVGLRL